jgi:hypothetical protein
VCVLNQVFLFMKINIILNKSQETKEEMGQGFSLWFWPDEEFDRQYRAQENNPQYKICRCLMRKHEVIHQPHIQHLDVTRDQTTLFKISLCLQCQDDLSNKIQQTISSSPPIRFFSHEISKAALFILQREMNQAQNPTSQYCTHPKYQVEIVHSTREINLHIIDESQPKKFLQRKTYTLFTYMSAVQDLPYMTLDPKPYKIKRNRHHDSWWSQFVNFFLYGARFS